MIRNRAEVQDPAYKWAYVQLAIDEGGEEVDEVAACVVVSHMNDPFPLDYLLHLHWHPYLHDSLYHLQRSLAKVPATPLLFICSIRFNSLSLPGDWLHSFTLERLRFGLWLAVQRQHSRLRPQPLLLDDGGPVCGLLDGAAAGDEGGLPDCGGHAESLPDEILRVLGGGVGDGLGHLLDGGHPGPLVLVVLGGEVEVGVVGLDAEDLRAFVLVLVEGLDGGDLPEGDFFGGIAVDCALFEGVEVRAGEDHPAALPLLEDAGALDEPALFDLVLADVGLRRLLPHHLHPIIIQYHSFNMRPIILKGHERPVTIVRFNYDGDLFFSGSAENKINLWEAFTGERLGSYETRASVRSLDVDINSQWLLACSNDGSLEIFDVKTGKSVKYMRFVYKLKQVEFDYGSRRFLLLHDEYKPHTPTRMKVYDFKTLFNFDVPKEADGAERIPRETDFPTLVPGEKNPVKTSTRALWYVDNQSFFIATNDGTVVHYDMKGEVIAKAVVHEGVKINSIAFSKNFAVLATAADNGSKIIDPETFEVLRYFKQELPMNAVSISPLFCSEKPKFHTVMGGGVSAIMAAMTAGNAGFEAHVCNVLHGNEVGKISGHYGPINSIEFFRDGRGFISGGEEGIIRIVRFAAEYFEENNPQFE